MNSQIVKTMSCMLMVFAMSHLCSAHAVQICSEAKAQKRAFPEADSFEKKLIVMTKNQLKKIRSMSHSKRASRIFRYSIVKKNGMVMGYTVVDTVWGKTSPVVLMVALNRDGTVKTLQILSHAKSPGMAIIQKHFLSQFEGKDVSDSIRIGRDIDAVTGATISSRATTVGVRRVVDRFSALVPRAEREPIKLTATFGREHHHGTKAK